MVQRLTLRRRNRYHTRSNIQRIVRTPGGKLAYLQVAKAGSRPSCRDCKAPLNGVSGVRGTVLRSVAKKDRTVTRAYGGNCCSKCVSDRVLRAFIVEESKAIKKVVAAEKVVKKDTKDAKKSSTKKTAKK